MPKISNRPMGENSTNLVILLSKEDKWAMRRPLTAD
jgi:hypothetical protein